MYIYQQGTTLASMEVDVESRILLVVEKKPFAHRWVRVSCTCLLRVSGFSNLRCIFLSRGSRERRRQTADGGRVGFVGAGRRMRKFARYDGTSLAIATRRSMAVLTHHAVAAIVTKAAGNERVSEGTVRFVGTSEAILAGRRRVHHRHAHTHAHHRKV